MSAALSNGHGAGRERVRVRIHSSTELLLSATSRHVGHMVHSDVEKQDMLINTELDQRDLSALKGSTLSQVPPIGKKLTWSHDSGLQTQVGKII